MFHLIEPDLGRISGGLRYNWAVVDVADGELVRHPVPGAWPEPTDRDIAKLQDLVDTLSTPILLDGLIGCCLPTPLTAPVPIVQLVHALAETPEALRRERECLSAADAVIATSQFSADALSRRHGVHATVATPGVTRRPLPAHGTGCHLISVGGIEPNKNQVFIARMLHRLVSRGITGWQCTFAGPVNDRGYAQQLEHELATLPAGATHLTGELDETALDALYAQADLLLLPSLAETFGLVVREATAAGISALVTADTGAEEALGGGQALPLDETLWANELQRWLTDGQYRTTLQTAARTARQELTYGWHATAQKILDVLRSV